MGLTRITREEVAKYLPASILSLGWYELLESKLDLSGSRVEIIDIKAHHGSERLIDLSILQDIGSFDLVLDLGTLEHCSNIANAFINVASSVKIGGHIVHELPLNMISHGYWNISPVWFRDFYAINGFVIERMDRTSDAPFDKSSVLPWPCDPGKFYYTVAESSLTLCVAKRMEHKPIVLPRCQSIWL